MNLIYEFRFTAPPGYSRLSPQKRAKARARAIERVKAIRLENKIAPRHEVEYDANEIMLIVRGLD